MEVFEQILQFRDSSLNTGCFLETVIDKLERTDISVETKRKILTQCTNIIKAEVNQMNHLLNRCLTIGLESVPTKIAPILVGPVDMGPLMYKPEPFDTETRVCPFGPQSFGPPQRPVFVSKKPTADLLHKTIHKQLAKVARTLTHLSECDGLTPEKKQQLKDLVESYKTGLEQAAKEQHPTVHNKTEPFACCVETKDIKTEQVEKPVPNAESHSVKLEEVRLKPSCVYKKIEIKPLEPLFTGEQDATIGDKDHNVRQQIRDAIKHAPILTTQEHPQPRIPTMTSEFDCTGRPKRTGFETPRQFMFGAKIEPQEKHETVTPNVI